MKNLKFIIPGAVFGLFVAGYVGLSLYSSAQAEKQIEDWLYDNKLEGQVQWQSVSASPFGASVTLKEVVVIAEQAPLKGLEVNVEKVRISDFADDRDLKSLAVDLQGVSFPAVADDQPSAVATMLFGELLAQSGRDQLQPLDLALQARYDNDASEASMSFSISIPDLFAAQVGTKVGNVRNLDSMFGESAAQLAVLASMGSRDLQRMLSKQSVLLKNAADMQQRMRGIELGDSSFMLQDLGYFKRRNLLKQRYDYALDPAKGDASAQRQEAFERDLRKQEKECVERWSRASEDAEQACTDVLALLNGQSDGFRVVSEPEERVRLGDLEALMDKPERASRILQRLNQRVETL
jgi:hypothetical protein